MARRRCRRRTSPALGPLDDEDLLAEILLRLPPKPSSLPRASLVCKGWRSIANDAAFRRRFRTHHRKPPIVGVFEKRDKELKFVPFLDPPDRIPSERFSLDLSDGFRFWFVLGCRHGRVLLLNWMSKVLLVFEPVSGDTHHILIPPEFILHGFWFMKTNAAVFSTAGDDHVHGDCHTSPFKVVLVGTREEHEALACVYSSETGVWGDLLSITEPWIDRISRFPSTLVGNTICWLLHEVGSAAGILQFDLDNQSLTVIHGPPADPMKSEIRIIRAEDGGLGFAILSYPSFQLWDHMVDCHGFSTWVLRKTISMDKIPDPSFAVLVGRLLMHI